MHEAVPEKWVRVMADYCSSGLWGPDGCMTEPGSLPVSAALKARLAAWCEAYEANDDYKPENERRKPLFDTAAHSGEGLKIARLIKAELPEWTVVYFDENRCDTSRADQPRSDYEYEILRER